MPDFFKMSGKEMIVLAAEIAILLTDNLTVAEQNALGNFLTGVGQNIIINAGQQEVREKREEGKSEKDEKKEKDKKDGDDNKTPVTR